MMMLDTIVKIGVYIIMFLSVFAALGVVLARNIFHSALFLVGALLGVAALFIALHAEFIAMVQILLYVGAVVTLIIFAIMLTQRIGDKTVPQTNKQSPLAFVTLLSFFLLLISLFLKIDWPFVLAGEANRGLMPVDTLALGKALLGEYVFPFEVVSIVLIGALIGSIVIARKD